jgi:hypothetical protein
VARPYTKSLIYEEVAAVFYLVGTVLYRTDTHKPAALHVDRCGYLTTWYRNSPTKVHRLLYTLYNRASPDGLLIDHIDRDRSNNTKENLRLCTVVDNSRNYSKQCTSKNKYKGISHEGGRWRARIRIGSGHVARFNIGSFETEIEAALAYNIAAAFFHKEFAALNKIEGIHI